MAPFLSDAGRDAAQARQSRVRRGWQPTGPLPAGDPVDPAWCPGPDESLDCLSGHWRLYQLRRGHRYSLDDQLLADFAIESAARVGLTPARTLDLGCGIGSVLLMVAWRLPDARALGVEAQAVSAALARRSIAFNGVEARVRVAEGDLRDPLHLAGEAPFELVTASPPYLPYGAGTVSARPQCDPCRFEARGGVDAYLEVAARALAAAGLVAVVHAARDRARVLAAASAVGLTCARWREVVGRDGKPPLLGLFAFVAGRGDPPPPEPPLLVRDADGARSAEYRALRLRAGFPP